MKVVLLFLLLPLACLILFIAWSSYPWSLDGKKAAPDVIHLEPKNFPYAEEKPWVLHLMTWNLGYLYGKGSEGPGYEYRDKNFYEERLKLLVQEIIKYSPDVICLQEVDFESSRTHFMNQAQYLAMEAGYPYVAEAVSWEANYIPFPYWPVKNHFGHMKSGGAILSRYPITSHEVVLLPKPAANPWWYNLFYLHRYFQKVTLEVGTHKLSLVNLHLEAFDKPNRLQQVKTLLEKVEKEKIDFVAGDFNMLPSFAAKKRNFEGGDDYENDSSFDVISKSSLGEVIPEVIYSLDESQYFTFPSWKPDRRLDYIFYNRQLKMMRAEILPSALSDHLPLKASFQLDSPKFNPYSQ